jgi:hypothetical protein
MVHRITAKAIMVLRSLPVYNIILYYVYAIILYYVYAIILYYYDYCSLCAFDLTPLVGIPKIIDN